jgi:hypothetical protein
MVHIISRPTSTLEITTAEVFAVVQQHYNSILFKQQLETAANSSDGLLRVMGRFFQFSSSFGPGQASLASHLAARKDLFNTLDEVGVFADRSVEVAAGIFFGAIDEFSDRATPGQFSHRVLALATLKGIATFFNFNLATLSHHICHHAPTQHGIQQVSRSYGVNTVMDDAALFRSIGFHLGTEVLGEDENRVLDRFFCTVRPDIMEFLDQAAIEVNGIEVPANIWFKRHIIAEAEHFDAGIAAANQALSYYSGTENLQQVKQWMLEGVKAIALLQHDTVGAFLSDY